jgi:hypothetical protein
METALREITLQRDLIPELEFRIRELEQLGFPNCQNVVEARGQLKRLTYDRYKHKYPTYLFFTDEQFDEIVKRNKLVISTCETYTGYIPDDCFEDVRNDNIDKEDLRGINYESVTITYDAPTHNGNYIEISKGCADFTHIVEYLLKIKGGTKEDFEDFNINHYRMTEINTAYKSVKNPTDLQILRFMYGNDYNPDDKLYGTAAKDNTTIKVSFKEEDLTGLYIAASAEKINKSKKKESKFSQIFSITKQEQPKDPIVFRYVKDGILVITFWK